MVQNANIPVKISVNGDIWLAIELIATTRYYCYTNRDES